MAYGTIKVDNITFDNGGVDKLITVSGLFYSTSGALTVTGTISGGSVTAPTATFTTLTGTTTAGTTATFTSGSFTSLTGVTTTVTSGVFGLGSAAAPSIAFSGDPNTGIYSPGADQVGISTGGTGRVFVDGSGNVGISDSSPSTNIIGTGAPTVVLRGTSGAQPTRSAGLCFISQDGTSKTLQYHDNGIFYTQSTTATAQVWFTNNLERMRIDSSGNVGIGVVPSTWGSPQKSIELAGGSSISFNTGAPQVYLNSNCYYNGTNWIYKTTGLVNQFVENPAGGGFIWNNAPSGTAGTAISFTQAMTLDASGRLGIGTTSPSQRLHVAGGNGSGNTTIGCYGGTSVGDYGLLILGNGSTDKASINVDATDNDLRFDLRGNAGAFKFVSGASYTERARIDSSGNVGVGVSSPQHPVHIDGTSGAVQFRAGVTYAGTGLDIKATENSDVTIDVNDSTKTVARALVFSQAGSERMRIDSSGNVGIGVVPSAWNSLIKALETSGGSLYTYSASNIGLTQNAYFDGAWRYKTTAAASSYYQAGSGHYWQTAPSGTAGAAISFTQAMTLDASGRLGIGTTSPVSLLHVSAATGITYATVGNGNGGTQFGVDSAGLSILSSFANNAIRFGSSSGSTFSETMRLDASGRLLVGTSSASVTCRAVFQGHQADNTASTDVYFQNGTAAASVLSGNALGTLSFAASGSRGAYITTVADANWTASSFPAHIQFATVASGSTSPTERLRITNDGVMCHDQPTPATYAAAATLTVADLKTGIITYTGGAATLTLPTGTLTEGGFAGIYTNMTFEWSVINTGAGICTIGAGTAHTIVGSGSVAIGASARFTSRRTAANTFISYRLS